MAELPHATCPTRDAIYAAYEKDSGDGFRAHLGASIIGKECERALWYDFRWVTQAKLPGRLLRLFETGQLAWGNSAMLLSREVMCCLGTRDELSPLVVIKLFADQLNERVFKSTSGFALRELGQVCRDEPKLILLQT